MNLYEINNEMQRLIEASIDPKTGEITDEKLFEEIESLNMVRESRIEYLGLVCKNNKADMELLIEKAKILEAEAKDLRGKAKAIENNTKRIKQYLFDNLNGEKFKTKLISLFYKDTPVVNTDNASFDTVPEKYIKIEKSFDKVPMLQAMQGGEEIEGCTIEVRTSLVVR